MVNRYADKWDKSKVRGEGHHRAKLTEAQVREIRSRSSEPVKLLAWEYKVKEAQILNIIHGRNWKGIL